jgi:hypothetical protein
MNMEGILCKEPTQDANLRVGLHYGGEVHRSWKKIQHIPNRHINQTDKYKLPVKFNHQIKLIAQLWDIIFQIS